MKKAQLNAIRHYYAEKKREALESDPRAVLFKYQSHYKTLRGFLNGSADMEELAKIRAERITEKREELRKMWEKQGFACGLKNIDSDSFIESYIK